MQFLVARNYALEGQSGLTCDLLPAESSSGNTALAPKYKAVSIESPIGSESPVSCGAAPAQVKRNVQPEPAWCQQPNCFTRLTASHSNKLSVTRRKTGYCCRIRTAKVYDASAPCLSNCMTRWINSVTGILPKGNEKRISLGRPVRTTTNTLGSLVSETGQDIKWQLGKFNLG